MRIICFGPGPKFKGGIQNYNTSLAKALDALGHEVHIVSWTQQYPAIIPREFIDKSSRSDILAGTRIQVHYVLNYNNPFTWKETVRSIQALQPDIVIFQWAIALQGIPLGYVINKLRHWGKCEVIADLHFVIQKEHSRLDKFCTQYGIRSAQTYITHAYKTVDELKELYPGRKFQITETGVRSKSDATTVIKLFHPIYDMFREVKEFDIQAYKRQHGLRKHVFLFFGFIRKYKGLHHVIPAFAELCKRRDDVSLLICGESFWQTLDQNKWSTKLKQFTFGLLKKLLTKNTSDEKDYRPLELIQTYGIQERVMVVNTFIPNEDVHKYFQVSDAVVLFYEYATPSGVESISYNFKKPLCATAVGHFPETIQDGFNGYLAQPNNIQDMARILEKMCNAPLPAANVESSTRNMSWENYAKAITGSKLA